MLVAVRIPAIDLRVALAAARRPHDLPIALGPPPGAPQLVGDCTPAAAAHGVRPGLTVGEALARCPELELVAADPDLVARAAERVTTGLEAIGAAVEVHAPPGSWCFESRGLERLHGGLGGVLRRARASVWVGADPRVGAGPSPFTALLAAHEAPSRRPLVVEPGRERAFLAPLPVERLPLDRRALAALRDLGVECVGAYASLPRASVLDRFGREGVAAWELARGEGDRPLRPRVPPRELTATMRFPDPLGALPALEDAARMLLRELAGAATVRGRALRALVLSAGLEQEGSWTRPVALRDATADPDRLALAALPHLGRIAAPVEWLSVAGDASGPPDGHQLALVDAGDGERRRRADEAARQAQAVRGREAVLRLVELEPWSRLPERRWALVPFTGSPGPGRSG